MSSSHTDSIALVSENENAGILAVVCSPLLAIVAVDLLVLILGYERLLPKAISARIVMYGHLLFAPATFWVVLNARKLGQRGALIGLCALVLAYIVLTRFRGPWAWQGTFDWYESSQGPWIWPALVGIAGGLTWSMLRVRSQTSAPKPRVPSDLFYILALGLAASLTFVVTKVCPIESQFAPTLHLALGGCSVVMLAVWLIAIRQGSHT